MWHEIEFKKTTTTCISKVAALRHSDDGFKLVLL